MREKMNKSDFINKLRTEIEHREMMVKAFNTAFQDVLTAFDGKVYNKRFVNALNEKLQGINPLLFAREEQGTHRESYSNYKDLFCVGITINCRFDKYNYQDKEQLYTNIIVIPENYRIDAEKSKAEKMTLIWYENFNKYTEEKKRVIKDYNKMIKVAQKVADSIKEFKELPNDFRENIGFLYSHYISYR
jgi:hypothetical protein